MKIILSHRKSHIIILVDMFYDRYALLKSLKTDTNTTTTTNNNNNSNNNSNKMIILIFLKARFRLFSKVTILNKRTAHVFIKTKKNFTIFCSQIKFSSLGRPTLKVFFLHVLRTTYIISS